MPRDASYSLDVGSGHVVNVERCGDSVALSSSLYDERDHVAFVGDTTAAVSAILSDYRYEPGRHLAESDRNALVDLIVTGVVSDPYKAHIDGVEAFLLSLANMGVDLNDPVYAAALASTLDVLANHIGCEEPVLADFRKPTAPSIRL